MAATKQLKEKAENLANRIKKIIDNAGQSPTEKAIASDLIMDELRKEYIYVRYAYFKRFFSSTKVTIDPYSDDVILELGTGDHEVSKGEEKPNDDDYVKIPAYSFGPFDAKAYFESNERFLWLIKEPFCENHKELIDQLYADDLNYYNQAKYYNKWENLEYPTHTNIVTRTKIILETCSNGFGMYQDEDTMMNAVMKNICILEVNHFPGLAFNTTNSKKTNSKDDYIQKWGKNNIELIRLLIQFYTPNIVVTGNVHECFYPKWDKSTITDYNLLEKLGFTLDNDFIKSHSDCLHNNYIFPVKEKNGPVFIIAYHPSMLSWYSNSKAKEDGERIRKYNLLKSKP